MSASYSLRYLGDPALTTPSTCVTQATPALIQLIETMTRICTAHRGLGLAAQQVGSTQAVILLSINGELGFYLNPRISNQSIEMQWALEGCLSMPGFFTSVKRHRQVTLHYQDAGFMSHSLTLTDLEARAAQHEVDHLDGGLITDGLSRPQRRRAERLVMNALYSRGGPSLEGREPLGNGGYRRTSAPAV